MTHQTITLPELIAIVRAFIHSPHPPLSDLWHAQRVSAIEAVKTYAAENNLTVAQVEEMTR